MKPSLRLTLIAITVQLTSIQTLEANYNKTNDTLTINWEFSYKENQPWDNLKDYTKRDEKVFGTTIAKQLSMINHMYIVYSTSENDYHPKIAKPSIYNALIVLKNHYKHLINENEISRTGAEEELQPYLIKGYVCYAEETNEIEKLLESATTVEEVKKVFDQIKLIKPIH